MSTPRDRKILKQNGYIAMEALQNIQGNPTLVNLSKFISETYETDVKSIKGPLKQVLDSGIDLGLLKREKGQYFLSSDKKNEIELNEEDNEPSDAMKRRRSRKRAASSGGSAKTASKPKSKSRSRSRKRKTKAMGDM